MNLQGELTAGRSDRHRPWLAASLALLVACLGAAPTPARSAVPVDVPPASSACVDGQRDVTSLPDHVRILSLAALADGGVVGVGSQTDGEIASALSMVIARWAAATGWTFTTTPTPSGRRGGLSSVAVAADGTVWAAGTRRMSVRYEWPMVVRWTDAGWLEDGPATGYGTVSAIASAPDGGVWIATQERTSSGSVSRVYRRRDAAWTRVGLPSVAGMERWTSIAAPASDRTVVVGNTVGALGVQPVVMVRTGSRWRRERVATGGAQVILRRVVARPDGALLATGWSIAPGPTAPAMLRRGADGVWRRVAVGGPTGQAGLVLEVGSTPEGSVLAGGSYLSGVGRWYPALRTKQADGWRVVPVPGWYAHGILGDPTRDGWLILAGTRKSGLSEWRLARVCTLLRADDPTLLSAARSPRGRVAVRGPGTGRRPARLAELEPRPARAPGRPRTGMSSAGPITGALELVDIARSVGLPDLTRSYGISTADLDLDGRGDLVWSRHGDPLAVYLHTDDGFRVHTAAGYARADRHVCAVGRLDADLRPDIACTTGGMSGVGLTSNELYLRPLGAGTRDSGTERGITDPVARGRLLAMFDADGDGDQDLFVGGQERPDGLPNLNRLLRNDGRARFTWSIASRLTSTFSAKLATPADLDGDGRTDLIVLSRASPPARPALHVYRNEGGVFRDVVGATGLATIGEDAIVVAQLDASERPDIVQLAASRLLVSLWRKGAYVPVLDLPVTRAHSVTAGDVDGDGDADLYVGQGNRARPVLDLLLRNDGTGAGWQVIDVPGTEAGTADAAVALDLDQDGRDEFVVVNGQDEPGPLFVIDGHSTEED